MNDDHLRYKILHLIRKVGGNLHLLSNLLNHPLNTLVETYNSLFFKYSLSIYPLIEIERMGLNKAMIWCKKSSIKYDTAKKLLGPLVSLFRGDIEEDKFTLIFYTDKEAYLYYKEKILDLLDKINMECDIALIEVYRRYINDEQCYDFSKNKWVCDNKFEYLSLPSKSLVDIHKQDTNLLVNIQVNPFVRYWVNPHYPHIKKYIRGFIYTLGNTNYLITTKGDFYVHSPYLLWTIKLSDGSYVSEYHVTKDALTSLVRELKGLDIIVSTKDLTFAHGFSVPYEIFKSNKWEMPKVVIE